MTAQQVQALMCGGSCMAMIAMVVAVVVYKVQIEPMNRRRGK